MSWDSVNKEKFKYLVIIIVTIFIGVSTFRIFEYYSSEMIIQMKASRNGRATIFFGSGKRYSFRIRESTKFKTYSIPIPKSEINPILIRPMNKTGKFSIYSVELKSPKTVQFLSGKKLNQKILMLKNTEKLPNTEYFSGKTIFNNALLHLGEVLPVNKVPFVYRIGLTILSMFFTFLLGLIINWLYQKTKKIKYIGFFILFLPVILGIVYVFLFGVNVPYFDGWVTVLLFEKLDSGTLAFSDFYAQHLEHRMFFTRFAILILGVLTKFNVVMEMYFIQCLMVIIMSILFLKFKNQFNFRIAKIPAWILPIPFLIFSWRQYENFLWGFQVSFVMPLVFSLLSFFFIDKLNRSYEKRKHLPNFVFAVIFAVISSFSMAMGLFTWVAGIFQLLFLSKENLKRYLYITIWAIAGTLTWTAYFLNYSKPENHPSVFHVLSYPIDSFKSFILCLGSSLFWNEPLSYLAGTIILLLIIILLAIIFKKNLMRENSFWLTLMLFSLLVSGSILIGRAGFGKSALLWSRYTTYSIPIVISLYVIIINLIYSNGKKRDNIIKTSCIILLILIMAGNVVSYINGYKIGEKWKSERKKQAFNVLTIEAQPDRALRGIFPSIPVLRNLAKKLKKLNYSVYSEKHKYSTPLNDGLKNSREEKPK